MKKIYFIAFFLCFSANNSFAHIELDIPTVAGDFVDSATKFQKTTIEPSVAKVKDLTTKGYSGAAGEFAKKDKIKKDVDDDKLKRGERAKGDVKKKIEKRRKLEKQIEQLEEAKLVNESVISARTSNKKETQNELKIVDEKYSAKLDELSKMYKEINAEISKAETEEEKKELEAKREQIKEIIITTNEQYKSEEEKIAEKYKVMDKVLEEEQKKAAEAFDKLKKKLKGSDKKEDLSEYQSQSANDVIEQEFLPEDVYLSSENVAELSKRRKKKLIKAVSSAYERGLLLKKYYKDKTDEGAQAKFMEAYERSQIADSEPDKAHMARISGNTEMMILVAKEMLEYSKVKTANLRLELTGAMALLDYKKKDLRTIDYTNYNMYDAYSLSDKEIKKRIKEFEKKQKKENKKKK